MPVPALMASIMAVTPTEGASCLPFTSTTPPITEAAKAQAPTDRDWETDAVHMRDLSKEVGELRALGM